MSILSELYADWSSLLEPMSIQLYWPCLAFMMMTTLFCALSLIWIQKMKCESKESQNDIILNSKLYTVKPELTTTSE
jgi:hypothetical protein